MIKNVIFDIGNVLVDFRWRALMEDLRLPEETRAAFQKSVFGSPLWAELDHGVYEEAEILEKFREENRAHLDAFNLVWDNRDKLVEPYAYAKEWIAQLKSRGLQVYLLSNYPRDMFTLHAERGSFPFLDAVDGKGSFGICQDGKTKCGYLCAPVKRIPFEGVRKCVYRRQGRKCRGCQRPRHQRNRL